MPADLMLGLVILIGVGVSFWAWALADRGMGLTLFALYAFLIPWGDTASLPFSSDFSSTSTLTGMVAAAVLGLALLTRSGGAVRPSPLAGPFVVFLGIALLSILWSRAPIESARDVFVLAGAMVVFVMVAASAADMRQLRQFELAAVLGGASVSTFAALQSQVGALSVGGSGVPRFETVGGDANATSAALVLPLAIAFSKMSDPLERRRARQLWGAAALVILLGMYLTVSRGGLIAAAVVIVAVLASGRRWRLLAGTALVGVAAATALLAVTPDIIGARLTNTSSTGRTQIWALGLSACQSLCDTGSGFGTFPEVYREEFIANPTAGGYQSQEFKAHNVFLQLAVELGIVGLMAFVVSWIVMTREALRLPRPHRAGPLAAVAGLAVTSNLITNADFKYYWLVPAYVAMAAAATSTTPDVEPEHHPSPLAPALSGSSR